MNAAASSWRTCTNRIRSWRVRSASMMPLMPSPGRPNTTSTPQSSRVSIRMSAAVDAIVGSFVGRARARSRTQSGGEHRALEGPPKLLGRLCARGRALVVTIELQGRRGAVEVLEQIARLLGGASDAPALHRLGVGLGVLDRRPGVRRQGDPRQAVGIDRDLTGGFLDRDHVLGRHGRAHFFASWPWTWRIIRRWSSSVGRVLPAQAFSSGSFAAWLSRRNAATSVSWSLPISLTYSRAKAGAGTL